MRKTCLGLHKLASELESRTGLVALLAAITSRQYVEFYFRVIAGFLLCLTYLSGPLIWLPLIFFFFYIQLIHMYWPLLCTRNCIWTGGGVALWWSETKGFRLSDAEQLLFHFSSENEDILAP